MGTEEATCIYCHRCHIPFTCRYLTLFTLMICDLLQSYAYLFADDGVPIGEKEELLKIARWTVLLTIQHPLYNFNGCGSCGQIKNYIEELISDLDFHITRTWLARFSAIVMTRDTPLEKMDDMVPGDLDMFELSHNGRPRLALFDFVGRLSRPSFVAG